MNKEQYMKTLRRRLRRLPHEDFERAVEYYEEYFAEAGPEGEQQAILDLGTPEEASEQIICELAVKNTQEPVKSVKKGLSAVWIGILAVCAAPIALPVLFMLLAVVVMMFAVVLSIILVLLSCGGILVISGPLSVLAGFSIVTESIPAAVVCIGDGLIMAGTGLLFVYGMYRLGKKFLSGLVQMFGHMVKKGGAGNAKRN